MRVFNPEKMKIADFHVKVEYFSSLINMIDANLISCNIAKQLYKNMLQKTEVDDTIIFSKI